MLAITLTASFLAGSYIFYSSRRRYKQLMQSTVFVPLIYEITASIGNYFTLKREARSRQRRKEGIQKELAHL